MIFRVIVISSLMIAFSTKAQDMDGFELYGSFKTNTIEKFIYLQNLENDAQAADSAVVSKGKFKFSGYSINPTLYRLYFKNNPKQYFFFVENKVMNWTGSGSNLAMGQLQGSYNQQLVQEFYTMEASTWNDSIINTLRTVFTDFDKRAANIRGQKYSEIMLQFAQKYPNQKATAYLASTNSDYINDDVLAKISDRIEGDAKTSIFGNLLVKESKMRLATKIGTKVKAYKTMSSDGKSVKISDYRKKYLLLYFWSSDATVCEPYTQKLKDIYNKYRAYPVEFLGISLDTLYSTWNNTVANQQHPWVSVSDMKGWETAIVKDFQIQQLPFTLLLDRDGIIIGKDRLPEEWDQILGIITKNMTVPITAKKDVKSQKNDALRTHNHKTENRKSKPKKRLFFDD